MSQQNIIIQQVTAELGYPLSSQQQVKAAAMVAAGCGQRQIVQHLKFIKCYEVGEQRRKVHLDHLKHVVAANMQLSGSEMQYFKDQVDKATGVVPDWETTGYPAMYGSNPESDKKAAKKILKEKKKKHEESKKRVKEKIAKEEKKKKIKEDAKIKKREEVVDAKFIKNFQQKYKNQGPSCMLEVD